MGSALLFQAKVLVVHSPGRRFHRGAGGVAADGPDGRTASQGGPKLRISLNPLPKGPPIVAIRTPKKNGSFPWNGLPVISAHVAFCAGVRTASIASRAALRSGG